eukprot:PhF_6_TR35762/c0_g1_i1/m.51960/K06696/PSME1; proteasome activator subunit 1 (PA28 alpha)
MQRPEKVVPKRRREGGDDHTTARHHDQQGHAELQTTTAKFTEDLDGVLAQFLLSVPATYDYLQKMLEKARGMNPRHSSSSSPPTPCRVPSLTMTTQQQQGPPQPSPTLGPSIQPQYLMFPDNTSVLEHLRLLKSAAYDLIVTFDGIQDWILIHVPAIKDEDNSGVEVQETVVQLIAGYYKLVKGVYSEEMEYLTRRAEMETSMMKQPGTVSWRKAIELHDVEEWDDIELAWRTLVRAVMLCQTLLQRNMEKLKEPRTAHRTMHM